MCQAIRDMVRQFSSAVGIGQLCYWMIGRQTQTQTQNAKHNQQEQILTKYT